MTQEQNSRLWELETKVIFDKIALSNDEQTEMDELKNIRSDEIMEHFEELDSKQMNAEIPIDGEYHKGEFTDGNILIQVLNYLKDEQIIVVLNFNTSDCEDWPVEKWKQWRTTALLVPSGFYGKITLSDPHPGYGGATMPLPECIFELINKFNGQCINPEEIVRLVAKALNENAIYDANISFEKNCVLLKIGSFKKNMPVHCWRLLKYKN